MKEKTYEACEEIMQQHDFNPNKNNGNKNNPNNPNNTNNGPTSHVGIPLSALQGILNNGQQTDDDDDDIIEQFLIDYNQEYKNAAPLLFREELLYQIESILISKNKANALLVGSAGVGKSAVVSELARLLANDDPYIPDQLKEYTIYELPLSNIVAGSKYVGQVEEKLKTVLDFIMDENEKRILFIDEIHLLMSNDSQTYQKIAQIMKPALARGKIKTIGATTLQEANSLSNDPAFARRFSRLIVDELSREQTIEVMKSMKMSFFKHYLNKVIIDDKVLETIAIIADEFKTAGSHRPDNAITLLDKSCANAVIQRKIMEQKAQNDPTVLAAIQAVPLITLSENIIRTTAKKLMTGNNKQKDIDFDELNTELDRIKGQDEIKEKLIDCVKRDSLGLFPKKQPLAILETGPSGVGKTEMARIISKHITGEPPIILNMTEYHSSASINRIIGAPAGYVGSDSNQELPFDTLESNPFRLIVLDEFEKCDKSIQRLFMSALEDGYITTAKGKIVDFSRTIIIATTNASCKERKTNTLGFATGKQSDNQDKDVDSALINVLSNYFDVELLNRFQNKIYEFNEISEDTYKQILDDIYKREVARILADKKRISLNTTLSSDKLDALSKKSYNAKFGARPAKKTVQSYIEDLVLNGQTTTTTCTIIDTESTDEASDNNITDKE